MVKAGTITRWIHHSMLFNSNLKCWLDMKSSLESRLVLMLNWSALTYWPLGALTAVQCQISKFQTNFKDKYIKYFCEIAIRWMPQHLTDHQSTMVQVMAWCRQATSHYLSQCWPGSFSPYDVTRPKWVKRTTLLTQIFRFRSTTWIW